MKIISFKAAFMLGLMGLAYSSRANFEEKSNREEGQFTASTVQEEIQCWTFSMTQMTQNI